MKKILYLLCIIILMSPCLLLSENISDSTDLDFHPISDTVEKVVIPKNEYHPSTRDQIKTRLNKIIDTLLSEYVDDIGTDTIFRYAVKGIANNLDPYTTYFEPTKYENFKERTRGTYAGLGIKITEDKDYITVITPIPESPAEKAGILPGDKIVLIEGKDAKNIGIHNAVKVLRGEAGSTVTITISRDSYDTPFDVQIVRDVIKLPALESKIISNYGYIRIYQFKETALYQFDEELQKILNLNPDGLIIDLRYNPGGLLNVVLQIASDLLPPRTVIVKTDGRTPPAKIYISYRRGIYTEIPLVILINKGSASASEILAGAVKDNKRGIIVGTRSFGKASVQKTLNLDNGAGLKYTFEHYATPLGKKIYKKGIEPDIYVDNGFETPPEEWMNDIPDTSIAEDTSIPKRMYLSNIKDKQLIRAIQILDAAKLLQGKKE